MRQPADQRVEPLVEPCVSWGPGGVWAPWGEVNWVRNLRAAGRATIRVHGRDEEVRATELDPDERIAFFRDVLAPFVRRFRFGVSFIKLVDGVGVTDPVRAADGRRVFEPHPFESEEP